MLFCLGCVAFTEGLQAFHQANLFDEIFSKRWLFKRIDQNIRGIKSKFGEFKLLARSDHSDNTVLGQFRAWVEKVAYDT